MSVGDWADLSIPVAAEGNGRRRGRVLLLCHNFPQMEMGVSHHRPEALYRYLPELGWDVTVIANGHAQLPKDVIPVQASTWHSKMHRPGSAVALARSMVGHAAGQQHPLAGTLHKLKRVWRRLPAWHDNYVAFSRRAGRLALQAGQQLGADMVWATCSPFSLAPHAIQVARRLGVPCVIDMRDPVFDYLRYADAQQHWFFRAVQEAAAVTLQNPASADAALMASLSPRRPLLILGGQWNESLDALPGPEFRIVHPGFLYGQDDYPRLLLEGLAQFLQQYPAARKTVRLSFAGVDSGLVSSLPQYEALADVLEVQGHVPYSRMLPQLRQAAMLVQFNHREARQLSHGLRAKLYDYLALPAPILFLGDPGSFSSRLVDWCGCALQASDAAQVARHIEASYRQWEREGRVEARRSNAALQYLSQRRAAAEFAEVFNALQEGREVRLRSGQPWLDGINTIESHG